MHGFDSARRGELPRYCEIATRKSGCLATAQFGGTCENRTEPTQSADFFQAHYPNFPDKSINPVNRRPIA
jgi:hypothetical protein